MLLNVQYRPPFLRVWDVIVFLTTAQINKLDLDRYEELSSLLSIGPKRYMYTIQCTLYIIGEYRDPLSPRMYCAHDVYNTVYGMLVLYYMKTTVLHQSMCDIFMVQAK